MSYKHWDSTEMKKLSLKHILGLNRSSTNILVRGELGKFPLKCAIDIRAVQFHKHLLKSDNEIIHNCITVGRNLFSDSFTHSFVGYLKNLQQNLCDRNIQITSLPKLKIKKLVREHYSSIWQRELMNCSKAEFLRQFKNKIRQEKYLSIINNRNLRVILTKFRLSDHGLNTEEGRHKNIKRQERFCPCCSLNKQIENETHFLLECPYYNNLRQGFMVNLTGHNFSTDSPASPKYTEFLFTSEELSILIPLANFIKSALTERYISITFNQKTWLQSQT